MNELKEVRSVIVDQEMEGIETFTGMEQANEYVLKNRQGEKLMEAREEGGTGGFFMRNLLESARPFTIKLYNRERECILEADRSFTLFLDHLDVRDGTGELIGTVEQHFSLLSKSFTVNDGRGGTTFTLTGPFFRPWTFHVKRGEENVGKITKEWSGMGKELFTDEDQFAVKFMGDMNEKEKKLLLAALFLMDFKYFEGED